MLSGIGWPGAKDFGQRIGVDAVGDDVIGGQQEFYLARLGLLQKILREIDLVCLDQRFADGAALAPSGTCTPCLRR